MKQKDHITPIMPWLCLIGAVAGGLLGFGFYGGIREACVGAGLGLLAPPAGVIMAAFLEVD